MAAYAALVSLMNNIEQIQRHTRLPISLDQKQMESLHEKISFLIDFLESYNYSHGVCQRMDDLESRIRDAAYAAEDIIETHVVGKIHAYSRSRKEENKIMAHIRCIFPQNKNKMLATTSASQSEKNPYLPRIEKVMEDIDLIKKEAMEIKNRRRIDGLPTTSLINAPSSSSVVVGKNAMVGFDHELAELLERLTGRHSSRQVIPIVGMGGKGKTTLARTAYEKPLILQYFDCRAWVSISQEYSLRRILLGLLGKESESSQMGEQDLGESLYKKLFGRRYLIVLDDIWSVEAWEMVMRFFPDNNNGSRLIITTRISSLATGFGWSNLEVNFLTGEKAWNLFSGIVFGQEDCPRELEEVGREIVTNCQGLPLSIVVIGGLIVKSDRTKEYWEYIARDTKTIVSLEGDEMCTKILYLSYHNLPVHLKPCFLYMGVFPEDEKIHISLLIDMWVGEGFLKPNSCKDLEIVAKEYLNDLLSRNLIISEHGCTEEIKYCMIHDLLRNLCLKEAHRGKFLYVPKMHDQDEIQSIGNQKRISFPTRSSIPKHLVTWKTEFLGRSLICPKALPLENFKLLRVLQGYDKYIRNSAKYSLRDTFKLVNLRFIAIKTSTHAKIPSSFCLLWNLQIFIVTGNSGQVILPLEIWEMTELRHLKFSSEIHLLDPPPSQEGVATMKNLRKLKGITDFMFSDEVVKRIPNIKELRISYVLIEKEMEMCLKSLGLLKNLESLHLTFYQMSGSPLLSNLTFTNSLKKLTLWSCRLQWKEMSMIASLPHLQILKLYDNAFKGPMWVLTEEVFHCLKYLLIYSCNSLMQWIADDTHFPCLERLALDGLRKLVEIPSGIGDIPTLQLIELDGCSKSVVTSAKRILEEQENLGNMSLKVEVHCKMDPELVSLATENFLVY